LTDVPVPKHGETGQTMVIEYAPASSFAGVDVQVMLNDVTEPPVVTLQTFGSIAACTATGTASGTARASAASFVRCRMSPPHSAETPDVTGFDLGYAMNYRKMR